MITRKHTVTTTTLIGGRQFVFEIASTIAAHKRGLGNRRGMLPDRGMLFVFTDTAIRRVWMKDMFFSIDIIWIGQDKRVQHIESNVSPDTYPAFFSIHEPTQYILELNSGMAQEAGIRVGQPLTF